MNDEYRFYPRDEVLVPRSRRFPMATAVGALSFFASLAGSSGTSPPTGTDFLYFLSVASILWDSGHPLFRVFNQKPALGNDRLVGGLGVFGTHPTNIY